MRIKLHFHADVPGEARAILQAECRAYTKTAMMAAAEQQPLASWVAARHSPYSNPLNLTDESERELDFVAAAKLTGDPASELTAG